MIENSLLAPGLLLHCPVSHHQQRDEDGDEDQVRAGRWQELSHNRRGQRIAVDPDIGDGGEANAEDVAEHAPGHGRGEIHILAEDEADDQHQHEAHDQGNTSEDRDRRVAENIVRHVKEHHVRQRAVEEVDHQRNEGQNCARAQDGIQALLAIREQQRQTGDEADQAVGDAPLRIQAETGQGIAEHVADRAGEEADDGAEGIAEENRDGDCRAQRHLADGWHEKHCAIEQP